MSKYKTVTSGSYKAEHTDHSGEIAKMRDRANLIVKTFRGTGKHEPSQAMVLEATLLMAAAALLEVHDDTGISLDNWIGPRQLVESALELCGYDSDTVFLPNGV